MTRSHSGSGPASPSRKGGESLDVRQNLVLLQIWENPEEGRDGAALRGAERIRIIVRDLGLQFQLCHLLAFYLWEN